MDGKPRVNVMNEIEVDEFQMKEVLRCLLHTILFNRALGPTEPREQDCELFDVTYVRCGDINVDKSVEVALSSFSDALSTGAKPVGPDLAKGRLLLSFYEIKKKSGWLGTTEEKVYWEQWIFPVLVNRRPRVAGPKGSPEAQESSRRQLNAEEALKATIIRILDHISKQPYDFSTYEMHPPPSGDKTKDKPNSMIVQYEMTYAL